MDMSFGGGGRATLNPQHMTRRLPPFKSQTGLKGRGWTVGVWLWLSPQSHVTQERPVMGTAMLLCWPDATQAVLMGHQGCPSLKTRSSGGHYVGD